VAATLPAGVTQTGGAPKEKKEIRQHRARDDRPPDTRGGHNLGEDAPATGMEDTGEYADARLPASACRIDTEGTKETGDMDIKKNKGHRIRPQKQKRRTWEKTPWPERKRNLTEFAADFPNGDNSHDATQHSSWSLSFCHRCGLTLAPARRRWSRCVHPPPPRGPTCYSLGPMHGRTLKLQTKHKTHHTTLPVNMVQYHCTPHPRFGVAVHKKCRDTDFATVRFTCLPTG
jgi:hypothetical protein